VTEQVIRLENVNLEFPRAKGTIEGITNIFRKSTKKIIQTNHSNIGLNNISLTINRGEIVGIIGKNGSGKSTLLRTIAGIYKPDKGWIGIDGQISLLAGVGVGMNKELTGRENIHLYGSMLGNNRETMEGLVDDIIQFSELQNFIDQPLRTYSSGMKARLAISVATAVKPDILLIDEVLGVGDPGFKKRSQKRIREMMDDSNTVVIVSHSFSLLKEICDRILMMEDGEMSLIGSPDDVIEAYYSSDKDLN